MTDEPPMTRYRRKPRRAVCHGRVARDICPIGVAAWRRFKIRSAPALRSSGDWSIAGAGRGHPGEPAAAAWQAKRARIGRRAGAFLGEGAGSR